MSVRSRLAAKIKRVMRIARFEEEMDMYDGEVGYNFQQVDFGTYRCSSSVEQLRDELRDHVHEDLRLYVVRSLRLVNGVLKQKGSGPNLEGGIVTLTTCKHAMRASRALNVGTWVAGVTSAEMPLRGQALFYLARVGGYATSHVEHWNALPHPTRSAKSMVHNALGDVFEPIEPEATAPDADMSKYKAFQVEHSHGMWDGVRLLGDRNGLEGDLRYRSHFGEPARLLRFDPSMTWVWERPTILRSGGVGRGFRRMTLGALLSTLTAEDAAR
jgi:hypothetical protein